MESTSTANAKRYELAHAVVGQFKARLQAQGQAQHNAVYSAAADTLFSLDDFVELSSKVLTGGKRSGLTKTWCKVADHLTLAFREASTEQGPGRTFRLAQLQERQDFIFSVKPQHLDYAHQALEDAASTFRCGLACEPGQPRPPIVFQDAGGLVDLMLSHWAELQKRATGNSLLKMRYPIESLFPEDRVPGAHCEQYHQNRWMQAIFTVSDQLSSWQTQKGSEPAFFGADLVVLPTLRLEIHDGKGWTDQVCAKALLSGLPWEQLERNAQTFFTPEHAAEIHRYDSVTCFDAEENMYYSIHVGADLLPWAAMQQKFGPCAPQIL
jgi:hypothetical protein